MDMRVLIAILIGVVGGTGPAGDPVRVRVTTLDGREIRGVVEDWTLDSGISVRTSADRVELIKRANLGGVEVLNPTVVAATGGWSVVCRDGTRFAAEIVGGDDARLLARHANAGVLGIPYGRLERLVRRGRAADSARGSSDEDVVVLANGDRVSGAVVGMAADGVTLAVDPAERRIGWDAVHAVLMAPVGTSDERGRRVSIELADGGILIASDLRWRGETIEAQGPGDQWIQLNQRGVRRVEIVADGRVWLGELKPIEIVSKSFFGRPWPIEKDRNVLGGPLRLGGRRHHRGIGLHSACRVTWPLDRAYERFTGLLGIDDAAGRLADAEVSILVDGRTLARFEHLRAGQTPRTIDVDLAGAETLEILVGFGLRGDVQDRVDLVNAALIRRPARVGGGVRSRSTVP